METSGRARAIGVAGRDPAREAAIGRPAAGSGQLAETRRSVIIWPMHRRRRRRAGPRRSLRRRRARRALRFGASRGRDARLSRAGVRPGARDRRGPLPHPGSLRAPRARARGHDRAGRPRRSRRRRSAGADPRGARCGGARSARGVGLQRRVPARSDGAPRRAARDHALARGRGARAPLPAHPGGPGRALRRRGQRADVGRRRGGVRSLPAPRATRLRRRPPPSRPRAPR